MKLISKFLFSCKNLTKSKKLNERRFFFLKETDSEHFLGCRFVSDLNMVYKVCYVNRINKQIELK